MTDYSPIIPVVPSDPITPSDPTAPLPLRPSPVVLTIIVTIATGMLSGVLLLTYNLAQKHGESEKEISTLTAYVETLRDRADITDTTLRDFKEPGPRFTAGQGAGMQRVQDGLIRRVEKIEEYLYGGWREKDKWKADGN